MARQDRWTLASIGNAWGIYATRVAQIAMRQESATAAGS
jgi:hypothetical protein